MSGPARQADGHYPPTPVRERKLSYPIGLDPTMALAGKHDVRALPSSFLVDRRGNLVAAAVGPREWDGPDAQALVEALLGRSGQGP